MAPPLRIGPARLHSVRQRRYTLPVTKLLASLAFLALAAGAAFGQPLVVWTPFEGAALEHLREDVADFRDAFGVDAEVVALDVSTIEARMLAEEPPPGLADVIVGVPHDRVGDMATAGVLADLSGFATSEFLADTSARARLAFTMGGSLVGLPLSVEGPALVYNRDLIGTLPASYEAFIAEAERLTTDARFGFLVDVGNFYFNYAWLATYGGYVFGRDGGSLRTNDVGLATEGAVRGARALRSLRFDHGLIPAGADYDFAHERFLRGSLAAFYTGPWAVPAAREAGVDVGVAPMPPLEDGTPWSGFMTAQGVVVREAGPRVTDAVNLAKWVTRPEAQVGYARAAGRIPASHGALERLEDDGIVAGFGRALLHAEPVPNVAAMGGVWGPMATASALITGRDDADVVDALEQAVRTIESD